MGKHERRAAERESAMERLESFTVTLAEKFEGELLTRLQNRKSAVLAGLALLAVGELVNLYTGGDSSYAVKEGLAGAAISGWGLYGVEKTRNVLLGFRREKGEVLGVGSDSSDDQE